MPLTYLILRGCTQIRDLAVLQGMPLISLDLGGFARINDLTPLQGMLLIQFGSRWLQED